MAIRRPATRSAARAGKASRASESNRSVGATQPPMPCANRVLTGPCPTAAGCKPASLDELLATADIVACTLPLSNETRQMMNAARFAQMKPGAIFVNGSRGGIVDEAALVAALDAGHLRAAALDVFATEPLPLDSPLRTHPKLTPLPHIGSATHETRRRMAELATDNLLQALAGERPACSYPL